MADMIVRNAFKRRAFDLHIAKLLDLRRTHGHSSFFNADGYIREYAYRYLRTWLSSRTPEEGGRMPQVHCDEMTDCTLESLSDCLTTETLDASLFREVLTILDEEDVSMYIGEGNLCPGDAQTAEFAVAYTVVDDLLRDATDTEDNFVYTKHWE